MAVYEDIVVPALMSQLDLMRQRPSYIAAAAIQPTTQHDFQLGDGDEIEIYRDKFIGEIGMSKTARSVRRTATIGRPASTTLKKDLVKIRLEEYFGPLDNNDDLQAAPLTITRRQMLYGRRRLWDGNVMGFTQSIGSTTLADDFQRWYDRCMLIDEVAKTSITRNPGDVADGATDVNSKVGVTDIRRTVLKLSQYNTPRFQDGHYHCLCDEMFLTHVREDSDFKEDQRAAITGQFFQGSQDQSVTYTGSQAAIMTPSGLPVFVPPQPVRYEGVLFFPSNNMPKKVINSLNTSLGYFFGPGSVLVGSGGAGGQVRVAVHQDTDYDRFFSYIWTMFGATQNPIPAEGDVQAGAVIEARSMAA